MTKIIFNNKPALSIHETDKKFNERRIHFVSHIENFVSHHTIFENTEEVTITFLDGGVSSLVSMLGTSDRKFVLKIPLSTIFSEGEGQFLKIWEAAGISVPHVIEEGILNKHS